ncbi:MAG: hypothetical protein N3D09_02340 [Archaeoglobaceae archaeon]|nr:hypothetical protein [Archaeoglobaceae archaeon]
MEVYAGEEYLFSALVSSKGLIKVRKDSEAGKSLKIARAKNYNLRVKVVN